MNFKITHQTNIYNISTKNGVSQLQTENHTDVSEERICCLGHRHLVALIAFLGCLMLNAHRLVMGVTIVAMVNHTSTENHQNRSTTSCKIDQSISKIHDEVQVIVTGEFDWSSELQGYVLGSGFIGYLVLLPLCGRFIQVWGTKKVFLMGNTVSAFFTFISPFTSWIHVYAIIAAQFCRGLGQGLMLPAVYGMMANWFPQDERAFLSTMVLCGFALGALVGGMISGWICDIPQLGWPYAFYAFGIMSLLISLFCALFIYETPESHPNVSQYELKLILGNGDMNFSKKKPPLPWKKVFSSIPFYALLIGQFGHYWSISYFLSVHPLYMGTILHFPMTENGILSTVPLLCKAIGAICASLTSTWLGNRNYVSINNLRKSCNSIGSFGYCACLLGVYFVGCDSTLNIVLFSLALYFGGLALSGTMIACLDMSPTFASTLSGLLATGASLANIIIPIMVGAITKDQTLEEWHEVFFITIGVVFSTAAVFQLFGSAEVQSWNYDTDEKNVNSNEAERTTHDKDGEKATVNTIEANTIEANTYHQDKYVKKYVEY